MTSALRTPSSSAESGIPTAVGPSIDGTITPAASRAVVLTKSPSELSERLTPPATLRSTRLGRILGPLPVLSERASTDTVRG